MKNPYDILERLYNLALDEHRARPTAFTAQVCDHVHAALNELDESEAASARPPEDSLDKLQINREFGVLPCWIDRARHKSDFPKPCGKRGTALVWDRAQVEAFFAARKETPVAGSPAVKAAAKALGRLGGLKGGKAKGKRK